MQVNPAPTISSVHGGARANAVTALVGPAGVLLPALVDAVCCEQRNQSSQNSTCVLVSRLPMTMMDDNDEEYCLLIN